MTEEKLMMQDPQPEHTCTFCKGTGKFTQGGVAYKSKCPMCTKGVVSKEDY